MNKNLLPSTCKKAFCFIGLQMFGLILIMAQRDSLPPVITLNPGSPGPIALKCDNGPYVDPGATAVDDKAPWNLSSAIIVSGTVNTRRPGKYLIRYVVQDVSGNRDTAWREVVVSPAPLHGFKTAVQSADLILLYTGRAFESARMAYQWKIDGQPFGTINSQDSMLVFKEDLNEKSFCMEEWFCDGDTSILFCYHSDDTLQNSISGHINFDENKNCIKDQQERTIDLPLQLWDENRVLKYSMHTVNGQFNNWDVKPGKYVLRVNSSVNNEYFICNPDSLLIDIQAEEEIKDLNFNVQCGKLKDIGVEHIQAGRMIPGRLFYVNPLIGFNSFFAKSRCLPDTVSGRLKVIVRGPVQYQELAQLALSPDSIRGNTLYYTVSNFTTLNSHAFNVLFKTDTSAQRNDTVSIEVALSDLSIDIDSSNNKKKVEQLVINSYDPNEVVIQPSVVEPGFQGLVSHTIHFQNTGNSEAFDIYITDTLDASLDPGSFKLLSSSHPMTYTLSGSALRFTFKDILLPDSHSNEAGSHGFVSFTATPFTALENAHVVYNTAHIYFDYNPAVVTNTAQLRVEEKTSALFGQVCCSNLKLFPNPASRFFTLEWEKEQKTEIEIYNAWGVLVDRIDVNAEQLKYTTDRLANGIYWIGVTQAEARVFIRLQVLN